MVRDERLKARIYDVLHRGYPGDVDFYSQVCRGAASVLELGCGMGRVLTRLAADGVERLVGLDLDPFHLELAAERLGQAATVVEGDMREFSLDSERFERVLIPFNTLYALPSDEDKVACLSAARHHLAPGGVLALDVYAVSAYDMRALPEIIGSDGDFAFLVELVLEALDARVVVWDRELPDGSARHYMMEYRYDVTFSGGEQRQLVQKVRHHFTTESDLRRVFTQAGLRIDGFFGDFERRPYRPPCGHFVVLATAMK